MPDLRAFHAATHRIHNGKVGAFASAPKANPIGDMDLGHRLRQNLQIANAKETGCKQQSLDFGYGDIGGIALRERRRSMISGFDNEEFGLRRRLGERVGRESTARRIHGQKTVLQPAAVPDFQAEHAKWNIKVRN